MARRLLDFARALPVVRGLALGTAFVAAPLGCETGVKQAAPAWRAAEQTAAGEGGSDGGAPASPAASPNEGGNGARAPGMDTLSSGGTRDDDAAGSGGQSSDGDGGSAGRRPAHPGGGGTGGGAGPFGAGQAGESGTGAEAAAGGLPGAAGTAAGAAGSAPVEPCPGDSDTDDDGVCNALDTDDDDDGVDDVDDRGGEGEDSSLIHTVPAGGKGHAPNAVMNELCVRDAIEEANATLGDAGLGQYAISVEHRHWARDPSGFYARSEAYGELFVSSESTQGPMTGTEFHLVRLDGEGEDDRYQSWGMDSWNDAFWGRWDASTLVVRGDGDRYTMYWRGGGLVHLRVGRVNPETGTAFDERLLEIAQTPVKGRCPWKVFLSRRLTRVARSELDYLCRDFDGVHDAAPGTFTPDPHCALGRFSETPEDLPRSEACSDELDHDEDGWNDCLDDDDDDDGVRDLDDRSLDGNDFALDPRRPGDEPSSAPNAILNDVCIQDAVKQSGWLDAATELGHDTSFLGLLRQAAGAGYDRKNSNGDIVPPVPGAGIEMEVRFISGDRTLQRGVRFTESAVGQPFVQRNVVARGAGDRYARFRRVPASESLEMARGTFDGSTFTGTSLIVRVPQRPLGPNKPCPSGYGGWTLGVESYRDAVPSDFEHVCVDEGRARTVGQEWYRSDETRCTCALGAALDCD